MASRTLKVTIVGDARRLQQTLGQTESTLNKFGSGLKRVGFVAGAALGGVAVAAGGVVAAAATMGIKTAASLEQAEIAFTSLLGSGKKAQAFLGDLKKFAARTPFELPGLVASARQLIGVGEAANKVIPTLTAWGDAAGALGLSQEQFQRAMLAVTQSMSKGKVQAEELMQITEAGIPIWTLLAKATGKPVPELQKLASQGKLLAKDVFPALEKQMGKDYGGSMAKQSQTLTGLWSTLMDTINIGLAETIKPFEKELKGGVKLAIDVAGKALGGFAGWLKETAVPALKEFIDQHGPAFRKAWNKVTEAVKDVWHWLKEELWPELEEGARLIGDRLLPKLNELKSGWNDNQGAITKMLLSLQPLVDKVVPLLIWLLDKTEDEVSGLITQLGWLARAWNLLLGPIMTVGRFIVNYIIGSFELLLKTLALIPGPMQRNFRAAAEAVTRFRENWNRQMDQLRGKNVIVSAKAVVTGRPEVIREGVRAGFLVGRARGGPIFGPGSKTSDSILARLSRDEHVWSAREVEGAGGHGAVERLRAAARGGMLPGFAVGGGITARFTDRTDHRAVTAGLQRPITAAVRTAASLAAKVATAAAAAFARAYSSLGGGSGPGGWRWQMHVLRAAFPGLALISGYRPGARTHATGRLSYHASGRAVDVPPSMSVFNWIRSNYGRNTKELIFSPAGRRQIHNGSPHFYTGVTRADHWNHVHWAYDQGGYLPPGLSMAYNGTGRPERVLSPRENGGMPITIDLRGATFLGNAHSIANDLAPQMASAIRAEQRRRGVAPTAQLG